MELHSCREAACASGAVQYLGGPCSKCGSRIRYTSSGRCVPCHRKSARSRFAGRTTEHHVSRVLTARHRAARAAGLPFSITADHLGLPPSTCPVLGTPMAFGGDRNSSPSLDRIDRERGYVEGNVEWISYRANRIKSDATPEELQRIADYYHRRETP